MAKDDERPQFNPKHRIAGAIILVSLAVIFIPMLLDESTPPAENQSLTQIPSRDSTVAETRVVVSPVTPADSAQIATSDSTPAQPTSEKPLPASPPPTETATADIKPEPTKSAPVIAVEKKTETASAKPVAARSSNVAEKISRGWMVQVGSFANTDNANRLRDKLKNLGYTVNSETVTVQGSKAVRLRVGPYREKSVATKAQTQLEKELNIKGILLAYP